MKSEGNVKKGVIYCSSKAMCQEIAEELECGYYHARVIDGADRLAEWVEKGGFIVATSALGTGVDFVGIVCIVHIGMPWSMIDYAQESGRGGRGGEVVDSVIIVEEGEVEDRAGQCNGSADVLATAQFMHVDGCRRGMMSEYLDGKRIDCRDIDSAGCDQCGERLIKWQESKSQCAGEWEQVSRAMDKLVDGCAVCWLMGDTMINVGKDYWMTHSTRRCKGRYERLSGEELDLFRGKYVRYKVDRHSCMKCGISQLYCATREDVGARCQWGNIVIPIVRAAVGQEAGIATIREAGYMGEVGGEFADYGKWLGQRHIRQVWGKYFSNAMVVCIRIILGFDDGD